MDAPRRRYGLLGRALFLTMDLFYENFLLHRAVPQILAFAYCHTSWLPYVIRPAWSYGLNADFEDHAEHESMGFVADLFRRIAQPRFS